MDEVGPHSIKKRALKSDKKKKGKQSNADPKRKKFVTLKKGWIVDVGTVYHGAKGRYHYFLCLQLILRHQIAALTKLWELPPEFEVKLFPLDTRPSSSAYLSFFRLFVKNFGLFILHYYPILRLLSRIFILRRTKRVMKP